MTQTTRACAYCETPLKNPRRVQCGALECQRLHRNEQQRQFQAKHRAKHGRSYSRSYDKPGMRTHAITCDQCGNEATVTKPNARYCSNSCWGAASHAASLARHSQVELAWKPTLRMPRRVTIVALPPLRRRWFSVCCPMCATWFVTDSSRHQHCTPRCGRRADKDRRRALERSAFVAPVSRPQVYERDHWTCQLCGEAVLRDEVVPHPQAPTLDHVIALSQGGTHEPDNVQLAHFYCNMIKNDGEWQEQGRPPAPWE